MLNGRSKKTYFYIKKAYSEKYLEKEGILDSIKSFFVREISFYRKFKKFFCATKKLTN
uniref:ribosomal protein L32 n=1 Tax=Hoya verticillata TaxID=206247 RepID=UPI002E75BEF0|nr:ribosomal protein L32 [Hoya verticillata]YP_011002739.1 ribosomal protein L32 [Hoya verticillata]WNS64434.1 ribosomal protein L32 [Hoya verticillata]WNS64436.1 ribosomal protein L32 [Hoya verticillata]